MHDDEHNIPVSQLERSRQEEDPLRHIRNGGILLLVGIVLRLQSQFHRVQRLWMLLDDADAIVAERILESAQVGGFRDFWFKDQLIKYSHDGQYSSHE